MYLGWMSTTTHTPLHLPPGMDVKSYVHDSPEGDSMNSWLNALRWTDDAIQEIVLGFRDRGLENETLFVMYYLFLIWLTKSRRPRIPLHRNETYPGRKSPQRSFPNSIHYLQSWHQESWQEKG
jgi:hypothetical protein